MITVNQAVTVLEEIFLDEFKSAHLDKRERPDIILDLHSLFKYQSRIYSFSDEALVKVLYGVLRTGRLTDSNRIDSDDVSYPLNVLTEVSQRLFIKLQDEENEEGDMEDIVVDLSRGLTDLLTLHGDKQTLIVDAVYQGTMSKEMWYNCFVHNPWLIVAVLLKYTSYELTENLYSYHMEAKELLKNMGVKYE